MRLGSLAAALSFLTLPRQSSSAEGNSCILALIHSATIRLQYSLLDHSKDWRVAQHLELVVVVLDASVAGLSESEMMLNHPKQPLILHSNSSKAMHADWA